MGGRSIKQVRSNKILIFLLTPFLIFFVAIFLLGLIHMVRVSFGVFPFSNTGFTLDYYIDILTQKEFYKSLLYTTYLGIVPTFISVGAGTLIAVLAFLYFDKSKQIFDLAKFPNVIPYTIYTFAVVLLVMQSGLLSRILYSLGFISSASEFPLFIYDNYGIGIMLVYSLKQIPFVFFLVYSALNKVGRKYIDVSFSLGAGTVFTIFKVILPTVKSAITSAFFLCFAFNFGSFEVPYIVGSPKYETLAIMSYRKYTSLNLEERPLSMVINILILIVCCVLLSRYISKSNKEVKHGE